MFTTEKDFPIITIQAALKEGKGYHVALRNFSLLGHKAGCSNPELTPNYLDNLCRLGLADILKDSWYTDNSVYEPLEKHPKILELISKIEQSENTTPEIRRRMLEVTALGKQFCDACVIERERS